jgi:hypothetical protein
MFELDGSNKLKIQPHILAIKEFGDIWNSDKSVEKENALKAFKYIFFTCDFKSPYKQSALNEEELIESVQRDFIGKKWDIPEDVKKAIAKYKELQYTKIFKIFDSLENVLDQVVSYMKDIDIKNMNENKVDNAIENIIKNAEKVPKVMIQLELLRKKLEKETSIAEKIKGGAKISQREIPKNRRK